MIKQAIVISVLPLQRVSHEQVLLLLNCEVRFVASRQFVDDRLILLERWSQNVANIWVGVAAVCKSHKCHKYITAHDCTCTRLHTASRNVGNTHRLKRSCSY